MKKTVILLTIAMLPLLHSCKDKPPIEGEHECRISYQVDNLTGKNITLSYNDGAEKEVSVAPGEKKEFFEYRGECGKNYMVPEGFFGMITDLSTEVYADGRQVDESITSDKKYWTFSAPEYYVATFLLTLTDAMLESIGYADGENIGTTNFSIQ